MPNSGYVIVFVFVFVLQRSYGGRNSTVELMVTVINKDHLLMASNGPLLQSGEESGASFIQTSLLFFFLTLLNTLHRMHICYTFSCQYSC